MEYILDFGRKKNWNKRDHLNTSGEYERIIRKYVLKKQEGVDRIGLAQDRDKRWNSDNKSQ
jgi:hypothetical protein